MSKKTFEEMQKQLEAQDPWLEGANLDTRGLPGFKKGLPKEQSFVDEAFGQTLVAESRESLRQAIGQLVGSNDSEIAAILKEAGIENPNQPKKVHLPGGLIGTVTRRDDGSYVCQVQTGDGIRRRFISKRGPDNAAMLAARKLKETEIRALTEAQEIEIARLCQLGQKNEAIARYLEYRVGKERGNAYASPEAALSDMKLQPVLRECAMFCWLNSRPDVRDSAEFQSFLAGYAGTRPLNFDLLNAAWDAFGPHQQRQTARAAVARLAEQEPTAEEIERGLDEMDDSEVSRQFWQTAKHVARAGR